MNKKGILGALLTLMLVLNVKVNFKDHSVSIAGKPAYAKVAGYEAACSTCAVWTADYVYDGISLFCIVGKGTFCISQSCTSGTCGRWFE
jgi:hypothetical protein